MNLNLKASTIKLLEENRNIYISPWGEQRFLVRIQKLLTVKENHDI